MKYTFVIESDPKIFSEIKEALEALDPKMGVRQYKSLDDFVVWLRGFVDKGKPGSKLAPAAPTPPPDANAAAAAAAPPAGAPAAPAAKKDDDEALELALVVIQSEELKHKGFSLLQKTRQYFISKGVCTAEAPTNFVVTAFDEETFDFSPYEHQVVSNIIFKPFDKLILKEHLGVALAGGEAGKSGDLYRQKTQSRVEMLKDVPIERLSEIGFSTKSDRPIEPGAIAKYYSSYFKVGNVSSCYAKTVSCLPHPELPKQFQVQLHFFGILNQQLSVLRRSIKTDKAHTTVKLEPEKKVKPKAPQTSGIAPVQEQKIKVGAGTRTSVKEPTEVVEPATPANLKNVVIITAPQAGSVQPTLESTFSNFAFTEYNDFMSFVLEVDPLNTSFSDPKSKEKPLPSESVKIFLDDKMTAITAMEPAPTESAMLLGSKAKSAIGQEPPFIKKLFGDDRNRWIVMVREGVKDPAKPVILRFRTGEDQLAFLKFTQFQKAKHEKLGEVLTVAVSICTDQEKKDFLNSLSRLPAKIDAIFVDRIFFGESPAERWTTLLGMLKDRHPPQGIKLYCITENPLNVDMLIETKAPIDDFFVRPVDGPYLAKKMKSVFPDLDLLEPLEYSSIPAVEVIKAAQPVLAHEVAESGISVNYYRKIPVGSFRNIVLWIPHEVGLPEFLASCVSVEEIEDEKKNKRYICNFIFFGVRDRDLKHIRRWIKEYYVHAKESEGG